MKKKILNHETTLCLIALVVLFILLATVWMVSGKIVYDAKNSSNIWTFNFNHIVYGSNTFKYDVGEYSPGRVLTQGTKVHEYGIVEEEVSCIPLTIIAYVFAFVLGLCSFLISIKLDRKALKKKILIAFSIGLVICAILIFLTPIFAKNKMIEATKRIYGFTSLDERYIKSRVYGSTFGGFMILVSSSLIFMSTSLKEKKPLKELTTTAIVEKQ